MTDELTDEEKKTIVGLRVSGYTYKVIAEEMDLDVETIRRVIDTMSLKDQYPNAENEKAYDGSDNPAKRELTARERDILVRLIDDILNHKRDNPPVFREFGDDIMPLPYWDFKPVPIRIGEGDLFHTLWKIREAIDPRDS